MEHGEWLAGGLCDRDGLAWCGVCRPAAPPSTPAVRSDPEPSSGGTGNAPLPVDSSCDELAPDGAATWTLGFGLRAWQGEALNAWEQSACRGVVEAATGTGKTVVALAAAQRLRERHCPSLYVVVVVPTIALAKQWATEFESALRVPANNIGELHSGRPRREFQKGQSVLVTVLDTARRELPDRVEGWRRSGRKVLLVIDECHRAAADANLGVLKMPVDYSLGLSATPERTDGAHQEVLYPCIGNPVYRYNLLKALDDEVLAPLTSVCLYVDFSPIERDLWDTNTADLAQAIQQLEMQHRLTMDSPRAWKRVSQLARRDDPSAKRLVSLVAKRKGLLAGAGERARCIAAVQQWLVGSESRAIVFHETIASADVMVESLRSAGLKVSNDHSQLPADQRVVQLARFKRGETRLLVAVKSLDEGIDVPDAAVAVIASGSRSARQRIQRLGRVLRRSGEKKAVAVTVLVRATPEEAEIGGRDGVLLGSHRVRHHRWPGTPIEEAVANVSSYSPRQPPRSPSSAADAIVLEIQDEDAAQQRQRPAPAAPAGYVATVVEYSPNAWHRVAEVRECSGMPPERFDRLQRAVRPAYYASLDRRLRDDPTLIFGVEIAAIRERWDRQRR